MRFDSTRASVRASPRSSRRLAAVLLLALVGAVALAGCSGDKAAPLREEDAEERARTSLEELAAAVAGSTDAAEDVRSVSGTFEAADEPDEGPDGEDDDMTTDDGGFGDSGFPSPSSATFTLELGDDAARHLEVSTSGDGFTFSVEIWCTPERDVIAFGSSRYESRPSGGDGPCADAAEELTPEDFASEENFANAQVEQHGDGTTTVTFHDGLENGTVTATLDSKGRLIRLATDMAEGSATMDIAYGDRRAITAPTGGERMPAEVLTSVASDDDSVTVTVEESQENPPLEEMRVRLLDDGRVVVNASLAGPEAGNGYSVSVDDADGDGQLSAGDAVTVTSSTGLPDGVEVELFDDWAGRAVGDSPIPGAGFALLAAGLCAAVLIGRRHLRG